MRCKDNSTSGRTRGLSFPCFCTFLEDFSYSCKQAVGSNLLPQKELGYDVDEEKDLFTELQAPPIICGLKVTSIFRNEKEAQRVSGLRTETQTKRQAQTEGPTEKTK